MKESSAEANFEVHEDVLDKVTTRLSKSVSPSGYGVVSAEDSEADGYYVLEWDSEACVFNENLEMSNSEVLEKGEIVVDGTYLNKVPRAKHWYTKGTRLAREKLKTTVRMTNIVLANLDLWGSHKTTSCLVHAMLQKHNDLVHIT
jgi:hypothetical protein